MTSSSQPIQQDRKIYSKKDRQIVRLYDSRSQPTQQDRKIDSKLDRERDSYSQPNKIEREKPNLIERIQDLCFLANPRRQQERQKDRQLDYRTSVISQANKIARNINRLYTSNLSQLNKIERQQKIHIFQYSNISEKEQLKYFISCILCIHEDGNISLEFPCHK